jgi:hypothetical protein
MPAEKVSELVSDSILSEFMSDKKWQAPIKEPATCYCYTIKDNKFNHNGVVTEIQHYTDGSQQWRRLIVQSPQLLLFILP